MSREDLQQVFSPPTLGLDISTTVDDVATVVVDHRIAVGRFSEMKRREGQFCASRRSSH